MKKFSMVLLICLLTNIFAVNAFADNKEMDHKTNLIFQQNEITTDSELYERALKGIRETESLIPKSVVFKSGTEDILDSNRPVAINHQTGEKIWGRNLITDQILKVEEINGVKNYYIKATVYSEIPDSPVMTDEDTCYISGAKYRCAFYYNLIDIEDDFDMPLGQQAAKLLKVEGEFIPPAAQAYSADNSKYLTFRVEGVTPDRYASFVSYEANRVYTGATHVFYPTSTFKPIFFTGGIGSFLNSQGLFAVDGVWKITNTHMGNYWDFCFKAVYSWIC